MIYTNSLLQQVLYLTIQLPLSIACTIIHCVLHTSTRYLAKRPLISWIHHLFFCVETRLAHLKKTIMQFSYYTSQGVNCTMSFTRLLLITIIASAILASHNINRAIRQATGKHRYPIILSLIHI